MQKSPLNSSGDFCCMGIITHYFKNNMSNEYEVDIKNEIFYGVR